MAAVTLFTVVVKEGGFAKLGEVLLIVVVGGEWITRHGYTEADDRLILQLVSVTLCASPCGHNQQRPNYRRLSPRRSTRSLPCFDCSTLLSCSIDHRTMPRMHRFKAPLSPTVRRSHSSKQISLKHSTNDYSIVESTPSSERGMQRLRTA